MTDKTQELDNRQHIKFNILVPFLTAITIKRQKEKGNRIKDTETAYYDFAVDLITDWHNKQIEAELEALLEEIKHEDLRTISQVITARIDKLKESE